MDFDDQWRHPWLNIRLYTALTGLLVVSGRGEERSRTTRWDRMRGPALSSHLHSSVVMWSCMYDPLYDWYSMGI